MFENNVYKKNLSPDYLKICQCETCSASIPKQNKRTYSFHL